MIRKLIGLFILIACVAFGKPTLAQDKTVDQIVAVVGKNIILKSDIEEMYKQQQAQGITTEGDMKCEILENFLVEKLLLAEAELDTTIIVSDSQLNQNLEQRIQYFISHLGSEKEVEAYFKKSITDLKADLEEVIKNQQMTQQMQQKIIDKVTVTPAEVRYHFKNLPDAEIPQIDAQVEYAQITVLPVISLEEEDRIKSTLRELKRRIESGESGFAPLAVIYSEDPGCCIQPKRRQNFECGKKRIWLPHYSGTRSQRRTTKNTSYPDETKGFSGCDEKSFWSDRQYCRFYP